MKTSEVEILKISIVKRLIVASALLHTPCYGIQVNDPSQRRLLELTQQSNGSFELITCNEIPFHLYGAKEKSIVETGKAEGFCRQANVTSKEVFDRHRLISKEYEIPLSQAEIAMVLAKIDLDMINAGRWNQYPKSKEPSRPFFGPCDRAFSFEEVSESKFFSPPPLPGPDSAIRSDKPIAEIIQSAFSECRKKSTTLTEADIKRRLEEASVKRYRHLPLSDQANSDISQLMNLIQPSRQWIKNHHDLNIYNERSDECKNEIERISSEASIIAQKNPYPLMTMVREYIPKNYSREISLGKCTRLLNLLFVYTEKYPSLKPKITSIEKQPTGIQPFDSGTYSTSVFKPVKISLPKRWLMEIGDEGTVSFSVPLGKSEFIPEIHMKVEKGTSKLQAPLADEPKVISVEKLKAGKFEVTEYNLEQTQYSDEEELPAPEVYRKYFEHRFIANSGGAQPFRMTWTYSERHIDYKPSKIARPLQFYSENRPLILQAIASTVANEDFLFNKKASTPIDANLEILGSKIKSIFPSNAVISKNAPDDEIAYYVYGTTMREEDKLFRIWIKRYKADSLGFEKQILEIAKKECDETADGAESCTRRTCEGLGKLESIKNKFGTLIYRANFKAKDECNPEVKMFRSSPMITLKSGVAAINSYDEQVSESFITSLQLE